MVIKYFLLLLAQTLVFSSTYAENSNAIQHTWPKGKIAISLSYDDALASQLDNAVPALNEYQLRASFYVVPTSQAFDSRLNEWRELAFQGHELGNHTLKHSCRSSLAGRDWVEHDRDLDTQSAKQVALEVRIANTLLKALDGQTERTLTVPCGDVLASGQNYVELIADQFIAIKGLETPAGFSITHVPSGQNGAALIKLIETAAEEVELINFIFHGVGGDYLAVSQEAHKELLAYLNKNSDRYWVDTYLNIMQARGVK